MISWNNIIIYSDGVKTAYILIKHGSNVQTTDEDGKTAYELAIKEGNQQEVHSISPTNNILFESNQIIFLLQVTRRSQISSKVILLMLKHFWFIFIRTKLNNFEVFVNVEFVIQERIKIMTKKQLVNIISVDGCIIFIGLLHSLIVNRNYQDCTELMSKLLHIHICINDFR